MIRWTPWWTFQDSDRQCSKRDSWGQWMAGSCCLLNYAVVRVSVVGEQLLSPKTRATSWSGSGRAVGFANVAVGQRRS